MIFFYFVLKILLLNQIYFLVKSSLIKGTLISLTLREKYPYLELFWSIFSRIWTEYGEIPSILGPGLIGPVRLTQSLYFFYGWSLFNTSSCSISFVTKICETKF